MALPIRQGATHKVVIGPAVAVGDGFTPVTTLALTTADEAEAILHDNGTVVDISAYSWAAITTADGYYHLTLQNGISGTVGHLTVVVNDDSLVLPLRTDFIVMDTGIYDSIYADAAVGLATQASVNTIDGIVDDILVDTAVIGALGAGLTDLGGMSTTMKAQVNTEVDGAFTSQMADSVSTDGSIATREQALYMLLAFLTEFGVSGTALTVYKVNGTTPLFTCALNNSSTPTALTRDG